MSESRYIKCYCPVCKRKTQHTISGKDSNNYSEPDEGFFETDTYYVAKCCGCETVTFLLEKEGTEYEQTDENGYCIVIPEVRTYPINENEVECINGHWSLPSEIYSAYHESIKAINADCPLLAALGLRTIVEAICKNKGIRTGKLWAKIEKLQTEGYITKVNKERLDEARFMGNESAHEFRVPSKDKLILVLDVVNTMLHDLYILDSKCKETFEYRFKDYKAFKSEVEKNINVSRSGDTGSIYCFLTERKYDNAKVNEFETQLKNEIKTTKFGKLKIKSETPGKRTIYEVV